MVAQKMLEEHDRNATEEHDNYEPDECDNNAAEHDNNAIKHETMQQNKTTINRRT